MHLKRIALGLGALYAAGVGFVFLTGGPLIAQPSGISQKVGVCDPKFAGHCIAPNADGSINVTGSFSLSNYALETGGNLAAAKTDLDALVAASANPAGILGTNGTTIASSSNPFDVIIRAGTALLGKVGIDQTTPGSTNGVTPVVGATGGANTYHVIAAASDNHAVIKNGAGTVYSITATSIHTTYQYVRLYDAGSGFNGCNSATNLKAGYLIPGASTGAGGTFQIPVGISFSTGIAVCVTGAFSDTDTTNATASVLSLNVNYG